MRLDEFMDKIEILGKEFSMYVDDEKGVSFPLNTVHLLTRVDMLELAKEEYQVAKFQKKIDDLDYKIENIKRATVHTIAPTTEGTAICGLTAENRL